MSDHNPTTNAPADLAEFARAWDERALSLARVAAALQGEGALIRDICPRCQQPRAKGGICGCPPPPTHATAMMLRDIWQDERGPQRVANLLKRLPEAERNRLAVDFWTLLRQSGCHGVSLVEVGIQFELVMLRAA